MKRIIAVIRGEKLEEVKKALIAVGCDGMNISEIKVRGRQLGIRESYRGSKYCIDLIPKSRVELIVKDEDVDEVSQAVIEAARTGDVGDGKIFISPIDNVIRIRTGEKGDDAV